MSGRVGGDGRRPAAESDLPLRVGRRQRHCARPALGRQSRNNVRTGKTTLQSGVRRRRDASRGAVPASARWHWATTALLGPCFFTASSARTRTTTAPCQATTATRRCSPPRRCRVQRRHGTPRPAPPLLFRRGKGNVVATRDSQPFFPVQSLQAHTIASFFQFSHNKFTR